LRLPNKPLNRQGEFTPHCAAYVNKVLEDNGIESWGNAYEVNKLFKNIYNGYSDIKSEE